MTQSAGSISAAILRSADPAWLKLRQEPIIEPELAIVDPHHHLWDAPRTRYMYEELLADASAGHNVRATVFAECTEAYRDSGPESLWPVGETEFIAGVAQRSTQEQDGRGLCAGIIAYADLSVGASVRELLEAHLEAGQGRFKGIRQSTSWDADSAVRSTIRTPPPQLLRDARLREGFAQLAALSLSFDAWVYHPQLADVADLADRFPDTTIVLDHVGGPLGIGPYAGKRDEVFKVWKDGIADLALRPNVQVKLGGLGMRISGFGFNEQALPPSSETLAAAWKPYVETCIEHFGTRRAMFESNFPVDQLSCSYAVLWNAFKRLAAAYSPGEKQDLFSATAARVYRLTLA